MIFKNIKNTVLLLLIAFFGMNSFSGTYADYVEVDTEVQEKYVKIFEEKLDIRVERLRVEKINEAFSRIDTISEIIQKDDTMSITDKIRKISILRALNEVLSDIRTEKTDLVREDAKVLRAYFNAISAHDFSDAYDMKYNPTSSLEYFSSLYTNIEEGEVAFKGEDKYLDGSIGVEVYIKEVDNETIQKYESVFRIIDGKIETVSVNDATDVVNIIESISSNGIYINVEETGAIKKIYYWEDEPRKKTEKTIIKEIKPINTFMAMNWKITLNKFDAEKNIIEYIIGGWEARISHVYNISNGKSIDFVNTIEDSGITNDGNYMYFCGRGGIGPGIGLLSYNYPEFTLEADIGKETGNTPEKCLGYDESTNSYKYELYGSDEVKSFSIPFFKPEG